MGLKADFSSFIALQNRIQETKSKIDSWEKRDIDVRGKDISIDDAEHVLDAKAMISKEENELKNLEQKLDKLKKAVTTSLLILRANSVQISLDHLGNFKVNVDHIESTDEDGDPFTEPELTYTKC
jgi:hypothetical protein